MMKKNMKSNQVGLLFFMRERSRSRDDTDYEPDGDGFDLSNPSRHSRDLGERLLRRGASRSRSSTPDKKHSKKK